MGAVLEALHDEWLLIVGSLVVGFLAGVTVDDAFDMLTAELRRRRATRKEHPMPDYPESARRIRAALLWALALAVAANAVLGVLLIVQRAATEDAARDAEDAQDQAANVATQLLDLTTCIATYQREFRDAYAARSQAAEDTSHALDRVIFAVARDDGERFELALQDYIEIRRDQERDRRANPLPEQPQTLCGVPADD